MSGTISLPPEALERLVTGLAEGAPTEALVDIKAEIIGQLGGDTGEASVVAGRFLLDVAEALARGVRAEAAFVSASRQLQQHMAAEVESTADKGHPLIAALSNGKGAAEAIEAAAGASPAVKAAFADALAAELAKGDRGTCESEGASLACALALGEKAGDAAKAAAAETSIPLAPGAALAATLAAGGEAADAALKALVGHLPPDQATAMLAAFQAAVSNGSDAGEALALAEQATARQAEQTAAAGNGVQADEVAAILATGGNVTAALTAAGVTGTAAGAALAAALARGQGVAAAAASAERVEAARSGQDAASASPSAEAALMQALASGEGAQQALAGQGEAFAASLSQALAQGSGLAAALGQAGQADLAAQSQADSAVVPAGPSGALLLALATGASLSADGNFAEALNAALASGKDVQTASATASLAVAELAIQSAAMVVEPADASPAQPSSPSLAAVAMAAAPEAPPVAAPTAPALTAPPPAAPSIPAVSAPVVQASTQTAFDNFLLQSALNILLPAAGPSPLAPSVALASLPQALPISMTTPVAFLAQVVPHANVAPVAGKVAGQAAVQDRPFSFSLPADAVTDADIAYGDRLTLSATLRDGSPLPGWLSFDAATRAFTGTPGNADVGPLHILVRGTDQAGLSAVAGFTLDVANVNDAPVVTGQLATQFGLQGQAFSYVLPAGTFADPDAPYGDYLSLSATLSNGAALPGWLSFDAATGKFSGTSGNADVGSLTVRVTATDSSGLTARAEFGLTVVNVNDAPVLVTAPSNQSATQDQPFTFTLPEGTFSDPDLAYGDHLALSATLSNGSALPSWLSFNAATRTFSGTPANGDVGSVQVRLTATDDAGLTARSDFTLNIKNVNDAPNVVSSPPTQSATQDQAFAFTLPAGTFADPDAPYGDHLSLSATLSNGAALPGWLSFDAATGKFSGTSSNADVGSLTVRVTTTDSSGLTARAEFGLTVVNVNDAPVLVTAPSNQSATQDQSFTFTLPEGTFSDPDLAYGDHLALSAMLSNGSALPSWLSFNAATRTFSGTPANGDVGSVQVRLTATDDAGLTARSDFTLNIKNVNDAPNVVSSPPTQSATQDQAFAFTLPAGTFADPDAPYGDHLSLSATLSNGAALPGWLSFDAATGKFSGTSGNADVGSLTVRVTTTDSSGLTARAEFGLTVVNVNDAPVLVTAPSNQSATQDQPFTFTLPAGTFSDPDLAYGDHLALSATLSNGSALPSWLSFNAATRTLSGTPANGDVGSVQVRLTATDDAGLTANSDFTLDVRGPIGNAPTNISLSPDAGHTIGYSLAPGHGLIGGLGGAAGYGETTLAKADDSFTGMDVAAAFADGFHLGSSTYTGASGFYVGTNGYVTFGTGSSGFNSEGIQAVNLPMVAVQYTDIDTRKGGDIYVDVTSDIVTVTYLDVHAYNIGITTTNSYQIRLHDLGAGDFAIELRYDTLNWGGSSGFATAGWTAGVAGGPNYGEVQGSGTAQFIQNTTFSNVNQAGIYAWEVHAGSIGSTVSVYEHTANGTVVGTLSTTDKDSSDSFTYSLLDDAGGRFALQTVGGKTQIVVADGAHLDHDQSPGHTVQVQTVDSGGNSFVKNLTVLVAEQALGQGLAPVSSSGNVMAAELTPAQEPAAASLQDGGAYRMLVEAATGGYTMAQTAPVQSPGEFNISSTNLPNHGAVALDADSHSHPVVHAHPVDQLHA